MIMEPFEVYRYYLALRLHFTTDTYDVVKQQGRVRASKNAFFRRNDLMSIRKVAESYSDEEIVNFLVANFVSGDRWGGVFDIQAKDRYADWKKRLESMSYTFEKEINKLVTYCLRNQLSIESIYQLHQTEHPYIMKAYLRQDVSIETMVILDRLVSFVDNLDKKLESDLVWPDISRLIKKYRPFLTFNQEKYHGIYRRAVGLHEK